MAVEAVADVFFRLGDTSLRELRPHSRRQHHDPNRLDTITTGMSFDVTVMVVDVFGQVALGYTGTVIFGTTDPDPGVVVPPAYTFSAADQGTHTFSAGFTLMTPGAWALTAADLDAGFSTSLPLTVTA